jgi:outer membrane receptor protein involved in Fe transport
MNCCRYLTVIVLAAAWPSLLPAQDDEAPVVLDPYKVQEYLENYATGNSFTALRVNAPLLEIPLSTSIITSGLLLDQGITDVNTAIRNISGAQAVQGGSEFQNYYFTRGMPNFYYRDGIRMELAGGNITPNATSIENIEVLKGPSSILYGMGTPGGIVNFNSKRPQFRHWQNWQATAGSYNHVRADLDVTGPATKQLAFRLIGTVDDANSYRDGVANTTTYLNPSVTVNLGANGQLFVLIDHADQELVPDGGIPTRPDGRLPAWATDATNLAQSFNTTSPRTALVDFASTRYSPNSPSMSGRTTNSGSWPRRCALITTAPRWPTTCSIRRRAACRACWDPISCCASGIRNSASGSLQSCEWKICSNSTTSWARRSGSISCCFPWTTGRPTPT